MEERVSRECDAPIERRSNKFRARSAGSFLRNAKLCYLIDFIGGCRRTRTFDPLIKSQMFSCSRMWSDRNRRALRGPLPTVRLLTKGCNSARGSLHNRANLPKPLWRCCAHLVREQPTSQ